MEKLIRGIVSGTVATLPMSMTMLRMRREEPREWLKALPPRIITMRLADRLGFRRKLDGEEKRGLIWASHFGYGAAMGGLYALLPRKISGPLYGFMVWAASYLGLMPALSLHRSAMRDAQSRNILMISAHLVWGLCMSLGFRMLGRAFRSRWA